MIRLDPTHFWDFMISTREGRVLVDVDGSVHDPRHTANKITHFNDSKRPYQTDGLPAYIVQCYDDKLTDNTPVLNLKTGDVVTLRQWISIISWMNMTDAEKKAAVHSLYGK